MNNIKFCDAIRKVNGDKCPNALMRVIEEYTHYKPAESYICCEYLEKALGDHNGLHSQMIGSLDSDVIDSIIMYKGGDYKIRNRIIVQYCPFCGKPRRRASEYKQKPAVRSGKKGVAA